MYEIGTSESRLPNLYSHYQFTKCKKTFIKIEEVARKLSKLGCRGYMIDVYFYKNAKQENTKLQDDFVYKK